MRFAKWEGLGNDFILVQAPPPEHAAGLAQEWCQRRRGIGADGLVFIAPGPAMVIYNSDGSRAQMCGNALRCLGGELWRQGLLQPDQWLEVASDSGPRRLRLNQIAPLEVEVDMGRPEIEESSQGWLVSMGNPHLVRLCPEGPVTPEFFQEWGPRLSRDTLPGGVNVEFVSQQGDDLRVQVWERGAGATEACGTGACAAMVVAQRQGWCLASTRVHLPGGVLTIAWSPGGPVWMTGEARFVFEGEK